MQSSPPLLSLLEQQVQRAVRAGEQMNESESSLNPVTSVFRRWVGN